MALTDYNLADQSGANFRSELNTILSILVANNSHATTPTTTFPYMFWADTTSGILKQRNAADSAWINLWTLAGGAPGLTDANTFTGVNTFNGGLDIGSTIAITGVLDEDTMSSDSAVKLATQQSIKAYVDASTPAAGANNRIINGNFKIAQRGTSFPAAGNGDYHLDRWRFYNNDTAVVTITQDTDTPNGNINHSLKVDVTTADVAVGAGTQYVIAQHVEGYNVGDLGFGTSDAKTFTLSFWVKSPKTGQHGVAFGNSAGNRWYPTTYTVSVADTWELKTITVTADTAGTWLTDSGLGLRVWFDLGSGSSVQGTADTWNAGGFNGVSGNVNVLDNTANNFYLADVQLEVGSNASDFEQRQYGQELDLCQRYFEVIGNGSEIAENIGVGQVPNSTNAEVRVAFRTTKRVDPTITINNATNFDIRAGGAVNTTTAILIQNINLNSVHVNPVVASGLTAGHGCLLRTTNTNASVHVSAEL